MSIWAVGNGNRHIVAAMDNRPPGLSRRRLLALGGAGLAASVAPIVAPPATSAAPAAREVLCRSAWGAAKARPGGRPHTPNRMTVHHTEVVLGDNADAPARLRQHQSYHQNTHGWTDIAYHFSVDRNGNIYELRSPDLVGDTATDYDPTGHFLVVCEGDFDKEAASEAQLSGAALIFAWAATRFGISPDTLAGHRDFAANTTCPGANLYEHVTSGDLLRRIDTLLAGGPVELPTICGPAADEIVRAIEAGVR
jgi:hypothetical protein